MTVTFSQIETWIKNTDSYSSGTKQAARDGLYKAFRELISEAAEVPHLKAEIDRLIARNVALDVQLREAKAAPKAPGWYVPNPSPAFPNYPPGVRAFGSMNEPSRPYISASTLGPIIPEDYEPDGYEQDIADPPQWVD